MKNNEFLKEKSIYFILFLPFYFYSGSYKLPVMDRDEARFSTASKTMMETKNFVDIKMQEKLGTKANWNLLVAIISNYF